MIRSFAVAVVTIALITIVSPSTSLLAQSGKPVPNHVPTDITGPAGISIEIYMNSGKVADLALNQQGTASTFLDFSNMGKVQVQIYVDVCQDGKTMKVLVVPGQPAEDKGCKRRMVGAGWNTTCGVTHITIDLTKFGAHIAGCGSFITSRNGLLTTGGGLIGLITLTQIGGGDNTTTFASTPQVVTPTNPPVVNVPPTIVITPVDPTPTNNTIPNQPPVTTIPTTPFNFNFVRPVGAWDHNTGVPGQSDECGAAETDPPLANMPFSVVITGPGVLQSSVTGTTTGSGLARFRSRINQFGSYLATLSMTAQGVTKSVAIAINVSGAANSCP